QPSSRFCSRPPCSNTLPASCVKPSPGRPTGQPCWPGCGTKIFLLCVRPSKTGIAITICSPKHCAAICSGAFRPRSPACTGAPPDAVFHLLAIQAWEEAAALIDNMARLELEQFGEDSRLLSWLLQLPESVVQRHISLLSVYIRLAVMALSSQEAERILARARI